MINFVKNSVIAVAVEDNFLDTVCFVMIEDEDQMKATLKKYKYGNNTGMTSMYQVIIWRPPDSPTYNANYSLLFIWLS